MSEANHFQMEEIPVRAATSDPADFSPKTQAVLLNLLLQLADNKYMLGKRYAEWVNSAPMLEAAVAAAAMTQDELGHARSLYPLFRTFPDAPPVLKKEEDRTDLINITFLDQPFGSWLDFVAANFLFDQALSVVFEAARESVFEPLKQRAAKILQEERFHTMYGATWVRSLARHDSPASYQLEVTLRRIWPEVICWLGQPGEKYQQYALDEGLLCDDVTILRQKFLRRVGPVLQEVGYTLPFSFEAATGQWGIGDELPWERWNPKTRRLN
ncbi:MAG: phenylacetate-CoA oxygenase subunit PaaI [Chloroflexota bacterium]|nr:MAG: phenylacetate-CoA oxygenase subunit PaaI [Chloroflexota bacterium]